MSKVIEIDNIDIHDISYLVSEWTKLAYFNYIAEHENKKPRFDSVFKKVKAELKYNGYQFSILPEDFKEHLKIISKDTFTNMKKAGF